MPYSYRDSISSLDHEAYKTAITRNTSFVEGYGKKLIPVETNHYQFGYRYNLSRNLTQGSALASVALLLWVSPCLPACRVFLQPTCPAGVTPAYGSAIFE